MASEIVDIFTANAGQDITNRLDSLNLDADVMDRQMVCLRNLFFIGHVDSRNSPKCLFSQYILLAFSIVMVAVIGSKFLAAVCRPSSWLDRRLSFWMLTVLSYTAPIR